MDVSGKAAYFVLDLLLPLAVGYLCRRRGWFSEDFFQRMMKLSIIVIYPVLALLGFWATRLNLELLWLPVLGVVLSIIPGVIAFFRAKAKYADPLDQGSYVLAAALSNTLTLGGISAFIIYGETGFAYVQLITLLGSLFLFLVCFPLAHWYSLGGRPGGQRMSVAEVLLSPNQLPAVGLLLGALLFYGGVPRPAWAAAMFDPLVHLGAWSCLVPVGYAADFGEMRQHWLATLDLTLIKFIATPLFAYAIGMLVISDPIVLSTLLITASTPTAIFTVVAVQVYRLNIHIAMTAFVLTHAIYFFLVFPLQFLLLTGKI